MLRKKRKFENRRGMKKQNYSAVRLDTEIGEAHSLAIKLYSEHTGYSIASIIETAIEQFFPDLDFEQLNGFDNNNQIVYNDNNQT